MYVGREAAAEKIVLAVDLANHQLAVAEYFHYGDSQFLRRQKPFQKSGVLGNVVGGIVEIKSFAADFNRFVVKTKRLISLEIVRCPAKMPEIPVETSFDGITIQMPLTNRPDLAHSIANFMLQQRKDPQAATAVTIIARSAASEALVAGLTIGDVIRLSETQTSTTALDLVIVGEHHSITKGGKLHAATYALEQSAPFNAWILGVVGRSELGETTVLGL